MPSEIVLKCSKAIANSGYKIAFTESATAGRMCAEFALTPHSGSILRGGLSCYEVFVKENIIEVPHTLIKTYTAESAEVTQALAEKCALLFKSDITVAVTGLTTPGGSETPEKPVGTMFLYIITPLGNISDRYVFSGTPESIVLQTTDRAADFIYTLLTNPDSI